MDMRSSPLRTKILLESNPLKSRILVRRFVVFRGARPPSYRKLGESGRGPPESLDAGAVDRRSKSNESLSTRNRETLSRSELGALYITITTVIMIIIIIINKGVTIS